MLCRLLLLTALLLDHLPLQLLWIFSFSTSQSFSINCPFELVFASSTCKTAHCRDGLGEAPKSRFAPGPRGPRGLWAPWPRCARMTQVEIENIKTYTRGHKKFAMVLCLKIINLGPIQEKIIKNRGGPVLKNDQRKTWTGENKNRDGPVLKNTDLRPTQENLKKSRWSCA